MRKGAEKSTPDMQTWPALNNNNSPYAAYRFGIALAAAPGGDMDPKGAIASNFTMVDYTDADTQMRRHAEQVIGHKSMQKTGKGSQIMERK